MGNLLIFDTRDQMAFINCLIADDCQHLIDTYRDLHDFLIVYTEDGHFFGVDKPLMFNSQTILCLEEDVIPFQDYFEVKHFLQSEFLKQIADGRP